MLLEYVGLSVLICRRPNLTFVLYNCTGSATKQLSADVADGLTIQPCSFVSSSAAIAVAARHVEFSVFMSVWALYAEGSSFHIVCDVDIVPGVVRTLDLVECVLKQMLLEY